MPISLFVDRHCRTFNILFRCANIMILEMENIMESKKFRTVFYVLILILFTLFGYLQGQKNPQAALVEGDGQYDNMKVSDEERNYIKKLREIKTIVDRDFLNEIDENKTEDGIYKGYVAALGDKYSVYYNAQEYKALNEHNSGEFGGVGLQVNSGKDYIEIIAPIKDTPADRAGIKAGDKVKAINGENFSPDQMEEAVKVMRGEPGTEVTLTILREVSGKTQELDFKLKRELIDVDSVYPKMLENNIGYIYISGFQERTFKDFKKALEDLQAQGAKKLVLDLRNNPGGLLDVTLEMADYLLGKANIMTVKYKTKDEETFSSDESQNNIPMVVLIDNGSASASEIMAGALQDNNRALLLGQKTYGKGVMQQIYNFGIGNDGTGMKLTVAEFFTPNHNKIHGIGVSPDIEVKLNDGVNKIGPENLDKDNQLQEAIKLIESK